MELFRVARPRKPKWDEGGAGLEQLELRWARVVQKFGARDTARCRRPASPPTRPEARQRSERPRPGRALGPRQRSAGAPAGGGAEAKSPPRSAVPACAALDHQL